MKFHLFLCLIQLMNAYPYNSCMCMLFLATIFSNNLQVCSSVYMISSDLSYFKLFIIFFRSEQDREPEHEAVSEAAGPGPVEESVADSMYFIVNFGLHDFLTFS